MFPGFGALNGFAQPLKLELPKPHPQVGKLKVLTQLRLSNNQLRWLPDEIGDCSALQVCPKVVLGEGGVSCSMVVLWEGGVSYLRGTPVVRFGSWGRGVRGEGSDLIVLTQLRLSNNSNNIEQFARTFA